MGAAFAALHAVLDPPHFGLHLFAEQRRAGGAADQLAHAGGGRDVDADGAVWDEIEEAGTWKAFKKSTALYHENFQRWDAGFGFRVGAEYNQHYNLMLGCDWGFTDMYRDEYRDAMYEGYRKGLVAAPLAKAKNFNFTIAFGYRF